MNRLTPILIFLLFCTYMGYGQTFEPIDSIDWSLSSDGDQSGTTPGNGYSWSAGMSGPDSDNNAIFSVQGSVFRIQDAEGTEGCDCDFDASTNCGQNDNTIFIPIAVVSGFCQVKVRMTVTTSGNLECGGTPDQLLPGCPSDIDASWAGTDAMSISLSGSALGDTDGHDICGEQGIGVVELTVDVNPDDAISLFITGGTQNIDEFYDISNVVIEGVRRDINDLNLTLTTQPKINNSNIICENNGTPLKFQVAASASNATFQWTGPNAWTSTAASPEINTYDPTWSGTYRVTVTDRNMCPIMEEIDVTVLESIDANCRPQALFSNLFATQCSDFTLPATDDDGVAGTWSPSDDLSLFADSTLTFTFTPGDPAIGEYSQLIVVFDISASNRPAIQPVDRPIYCNSVSDEVDLIQLFNMNLDYELTVTGDIALFDKITTGQSINSVEQEYRTFTFLGVDPGSYDFFVEALAPCQTSTPFLISLNLTVIEQNPVILNADLCAGDYIDTLGYRIFGDTIITTGGACDTVVRATINKLQPGVRPASLPHPTGFQSSDCGDLFYFYGNEFSGSSQGIFVAAKRDEAPPRGPDFDTIFYTSYSGPFTLPYSASNGCDSIVNINLNLGNPNITLNSIPLCPGMDTLVTYRGADYLITEANPVIFPPRVNRPDGSCDVHEIRGVYAVTQRDTIIGMFCASQDTMIEGRLFDVNNPTDLISIPAANSADCPSLLFVDLTFDEPERGVLDTSICAGGLITVGGIDFTEAVTAMDIWLPTPASDGCDSIVTVTVKIQDPVAETINPTVCSDSTFTFLGKDYDSGNSSGLDTLRSAQGCDSILYDINVSFFNDPLLIVNPDTSFCANSSVFYPEYNVTLDANRLNYDTLIITPNGCSQTVMFSGTLLPVKDTMLEVTICAGASYILGSQTLTSSVVATEIFTTSLGCDSTVTVDLTVTEEIIEDLDISICSGATYILGSQTLTTTGSYTEVFIAGAANGCDSTVNLTLTIMAPAEFPISESICSGGNFDFNGRILTEANEYRDTLTASNTCDSIVVLTLTVMEPIITQYDDSTCEGLSYPWADEFFTIAGSYPDTLISPDGCDSIVILNLTFNPAPITEIAETICEGEIFDFNGQELTSSGVYDSERVTFIGCDSLVRLTLTVNPIERTSLNEPFLCAEGQTVAVGNNVYNTTGVYVDTLQAVSGCDSIVTLDLVIPDSIITPIDTFVCEGSELILNADRLSTSGIHDVFFFAANGCDSIVRVNLEVLQPVEMDTSITLCPGETILVFNNSFGNSTDREITETEFFTQVGTSTRGCDSTVNLTLTRVAIGPPVLNRTICFDETFQVGNSIYTESGFYRDTLQSTFGCDSIIRTDLNVKSQLINDISPSICFGETFEVGDSILSEPGFYAIEIQSVDGCDSLLNVTLIIEDIAITDLNETICNGDEFVVGNSTYNLTGSYADTILSATGCDSIVNLELIVLIAERIQLDTTICARETLDIEGSLFSSSTVESIIISSVAGCDSIIIELDLTVLEEINTVINESLCQGQSTQVGTSTYSTEGTFMDTLVASIGCDSIVTLNLTIIPSPVTELAEAICEGETYDYDGELLTESGIYESQVVTADGCDSIVRLTLIVNPVERTPLMESFSCAGATYTVGNNVYTASGMYVDTLQASTGCDSIVSLSLIIPDSIITPIDTFICEGSELILNADRLSTAGIHDVVFFAANGCDSIVRVNLEVLQPVESDLDIVLCPGETILVFNNSFGNSTDREITETEFFTQLGVSSRGCDSTVNLTLTRVAVGPPILNRTICFNETFQVGNSIYTESGFYRDTLPSSFGCDSIVRLDLNVRPQYISDISPEICTDGTFTVGDSVLSEAGFYAITIPSVDGCDSLLNVTLSIGDAFITPLSESICSGEEFIVGNSTYNSSGSYTDTIQSFAGCDSIINLELFVLEVEQIQLDTTICAGEILNIGGSDFAMSITDIVTILSQEGCDSIVIDLNLTVLNEINTVSNFSICPGQSIEVGTSTYNTEGTFMDTLLASTGCDSTIRTIITFAESITTSQTQQICTGGSVTVGTSTYTATGEYIDTLNSSTGCDSIVMLSLDVVSLVEEAITATICMGETYTFNGQDLSAAGQYRDSLISNLGCDSIVTLDLTVSPELTIAIENIIGSCEGVANGTFIIRDISGATPPFAVSGLPGISTIDMLPFTVTGLNPQIYTFDLADANGCTASIDVEITEDRNSAVTINSTTIDPTGLYQLSLGFNGTIGSIAWDNTPGLSCYDCEDPMVDILERTTFRVVVTDVDGCISIAEITLDISSIGNIYIPNVFNPESSSGNHRFYIHGEDDSESIYDLQIYDRWGNLIFETIGAALSDPAFGWDGTMGGTMLNADVYVYSGRVYDANGSEKFVNGDLTMLK